MNRRRLQLACAGLAVFLVALLVKLPAGWLLHWYSDNLPEKMEWQEVSGTVFDATLNDVNLLLPDNRRLFFETAELQTSLTALLYGRLGVTFQLHGYQGGLSGYAEFGRSTWRLSGIEGGLSLSAMTELMPELKTMAAGGRLIFRGNDLAGYYEGLLSSGELDATLSDLRVGLIETRNPLGNYAIQLQAGETNGIRGDIKTVSNDALLNLSGAFEMQADPRQIRFDGLARAGANASEAVRDILPLLGRVENDRAIINWQSAF